MTAYVTDDDGVTRPVCTGEPPTAAPDEVARMVRRLREVAGGADTELGEDSRLMYDAAALLWRLGQGWIPVKFNMTNYPVAKHRGEWDTIDRQREDGKIFRFTLPPLPAPGASDD